MVDKNKNLLAIILSGLFGLIVFLIIYHEVLDPRYVDWMLAAGPDPVQHYTGWVMYRAADWVFPWGLANNYAYPFGVPITYTDSIPLLAIFFKIFRSILSVNFQYFGLWIASCFILQGVFGYLLLKSFTKNIGLALRGSIIFIFSPIMLFRLGGHFALGGHWLLLWALWLIFRDNKNSRWLEWAVLLSLALMVHPYLLFMVFSLWCAYWLDIFLVKKRVSWIKALILFAGEMLWVLLLAYCLGIFHVGEANAPGYGNFSMNLNSLINSMGWSRVLPEMGIVQYQGEGFNYLGLGVLFAFVVSIGTYIWQKKYKSIRLKNWPLILVLISLTLLSISHVVTYGSHILFTIPLSEQLINNFFGIFRSSGRFFWPVFYVIVLSSFYFTKVYKYKFSTAIIVVAIALQIFDLSSILANRGLAFADQKHSNPTLVQGLDELDFNYKHIVFIPVAPHRNYMDFAIYAADHGMTINSAYFARPVEGLEKEIDYQIDLIKAGLPESDTLYVLSRDVDILSANIDQTKHLITIVDDTTLLLPNYKQ